MSLILPKRDLLLPRKQRGMLMMPLLGLNGGGSVYVTTSADYPGTDDYMEKGSALTSVASGRKGILSFWARADAFSTNPSFLATGSQSLTCRSSTAGGLTLDLYRADGTVIVSIGASSNTSVSQWAHFLWSWDMDAGYWFAKNGALEISSSTTFGVDVAYADATNWRIGEQLDGNGDYNGLMSEYYLNTVDSLDLTNNSNIAKFIKLLRPVSLGSNGSIPTGAQPILYMPQLNNFGYGGVFNAGGDPITNSTQPVVGQ